MPSEMNPITSTSAENPNQRFRSPTKSIRCQRGMRWPLAPMKAGLSNHRKPARSPSRARVAATAVTIETSVPIRSMSANPLTPPVAARKRMSAVIIVTTFASMIVLNPFV